MPKISGDFCRVLQTFEISFIFALRLQSGGELWYSQGSIAAFKEGRVRTRILKQIPAFLPSCGKEVWR